jgi:predicted ATPase
MITRIYADNFRCLSNFEFRPGQVNLLLGDNGTGKTSLFDVLRLLKGLLVEGLPVASLFGTHEKTVWDPRDVQTFELEVEGPDGIFTYRLQVEHPARQTTQQPELKKEELDLDGKDLFLYANGQVHLFEDDHSLGAVFPVKPARSFIPNLESQNAKLQWFKTFVEGIGVFQLNPFALDPLTKQDDPSLTFNGSNFASWLRHLNDESPEAKLESEKRLAEAIPGFARFRFQTMGDRKGLRATFSTEGGLDYELAFSALSEGQRVLSVLYSVLYGLVGPSSVLCFDEPENFISLQEIQPWFQSLQDLAEDRCGQIMVISHHPEVIDYLATESAFRFERSDGGFVRVGEWIPDPSQIMKPSEILARGG